MLSELPLTPDDYVSLPPYSLLIEYENGPHATVPVADIETAVLRTWNRHPAHPHACILLTDARGQLVLGRLRDIYHATNEAFMVTREVFPDVLAEAIEEWEMAVRQVRTSRAILKEMGASWPL